MVQAEGTACAKPRKQGVSRARLHSRTGGDLPGGPGVKNLPCNEGGVDLIPGWEQRACMLRSVAPK